MSYGPLLAAALLLACSNTEEPLHHHPARPAASTPASITIASRTPLLPTFPCSRCHAERAPDPHERRLVLFHAQKILHHGEQRGWCYRCHSKEHLDELHQPDGTPVAFDEAYELCGACHGDKLRDWKAGIHGLTTGSWQGARSRRSCPACHDPHEPHFPQMIPEHAPPRPRTAPAPVHPEPERAHADDQPR